MRSVFNASDTEKHHGGDRVTDTRAFHLKSRNYFCNATRCALERKIQTMFRFLIPKKALQGKRLWPAAAPAPCVIALADDSQSHFVAKMNASAPGAGHLNLTIVE
jgi:hypothetical protein